MKKIQNQLQQSYFGATQPMWKSDMRWLVERVKQLEEVLNTVANVTTDGDVQLLCMDAIENNKEEMV